MSAAALDIGYAIGLEPRRAVAYMRSMGVEVAGDWRASEAAARRHALAIAGVTQIGVTQDIHAGLVRAVAKGQTYEQFAAELEPRLKAAGWWGKGARAGRGKVDPKTGEIAPDGKGLTHSRLKFIYREHTANAYAAAKDAHAVATGATRWQYSAVLDSRTRPTHRAMHGRIFRMDDAGAESFKPRNGFGCRCGCIYYWDAETPPTPDAQTRTVEPAQAGDAPVVELVDKSLPRGAFRPDRGFNQAPGAAWRRALSAYPIDRAGDLPPSLGALAIYRHLQRPEVLDGLVAQWREFAQPMIPRTPDDKVRTRGAHFVVGAFSPDVVAALAARGIELTTAALTMMDRAVAHTMRTGKAAPLPMDWFMDLPRHLFEGPGALTLDRGKLLMWFDLPREAGKLAISVNEKVKIAGSRRLENVIDSGGVINLETAADVLQKADVVWRR